VRASSDTAVGTAGGALLQAQITSRRASFLTSRSLPAVRHARRLFVLAAQQVLVRAPGGAADLLVGRAALQREEERLSLRPAQAADGVEDGPHVLGAALAGR